MKSIYTFLKKPFFGKYQVTWNWPEGVARDGWHDLVLESRSGGRLAAIHGEAKTEAQGMIVLAHPMGRAAKGHWLKNGLAEALRARGFHVLAFDFNGFGASGQGNFHYPLDVIAAGETLREKYPELPLGVHGASFGAAWALCACARETHPFDWAVLENPFTTLGVEPGRGLADA
ncbi:MAG: alpha/beta fold hydrolase [Proteobacteria bacterium]|nr:alpha/beta fold hydrolase [Pseudomonadota bacterium]